MFDRLIRYWRVAGTGLSFLSFGIGGLLLRILIFPLINLFVWEQQVRIALARNVIRVTFRAFIGFMHILGVLRYEVKEGIE